MNAGKQSIRRSVVMTLGVASAASLLALVAHGRTISQGKSDPFAYEMVVTYFNEGASTRSERVFRAVRKDGSYAEVTSLTAPNGSVYERHEVVDIQRRQRSISYPGVKVITTVPLSERSVLRVRADKGKRCGLGKEAQSSRLHGLDVIQSQFQSGGDVPAEESLEIQKWHAPQLGCEELGSTWRKNGQVVLVREVKRIEIGEPAGSYFVNSPDLVEMSPVEAALVLAKELGLGISGALSPLEELVEQKYHEDRAAAGWE